MPPQRVLVPGVDGAAPPLPPPVEEEKDVSLSLLLVLYFELQLAVPFEYNRS